MNKTDFKNIKVEYRQDGLYIKDTAICLVYRAEKKIHQSVIKRMCEKYKPKSVIELGFGLGDTCDAFQEYGLDKHIIIESNKEVYEDALVWAKGKEGVDIINADYRDVKIDEEVDLVYEDLLDLIDGHKPFKNPFKSKHCENFMGSFFTEAENIRLNEILKYNYDESRYRQHKIEWNR